MNSNLSSLKALVPGVFVVGSQKNRLNEMFFWAPKAYV